MANTHMHGGQGVNVGIWVGIAAGAAVGIAIALSRRSHRRTPWDQAREVTKRVADHSGDFADATREIVDRMKTIYEEGCKVVEDAGQLWHRSRKLVGV